LFIDFVSLNLNINFGTVSVENFINLKNLQLLCVAGFMEEYVWDAGSDEKKLLIQRKMR